MSIRKDLHRVFTAAIWLSSATIATPLLPAGRSAGEPGPRVLAQDPPAATFASRSDLVVLHVVVKDWRGAPVPGLTQTSFTVLEDDRPQEIQFFGEQDTPVDAGLVVDSSGSMLAVRERVIAAAGAFAETSHPDDRIFALTFTEPRTHRSIQVKADRARRVELESGDLERVARQVAFFESELVFVNYTPRFAAYYCAYRNEEVVALELSPSHAFVQTPGPGAGEQLG